MSLDSQYQLKRDWLHKTDYELPMSIIMSWLDTYPLEVINLAFKAVCKKKNILRTEGKDMSFDHCLGYTISTMNNEMQKRGVPAL